MPISQQVRKDQQDLSSRTPSPVMPEVSATLNVQAEQNDASRLMAAIGSWRENLGYVDDRNRRAKAVADTEAQKQADKRNNAIGQRDAETGAFDEDLFAQSEAYKDGRNEMLGKAKGFAWYNQSLREMEDSVRKDPNFDYESWRKQKLADVYQGIDDPAQLESLNHSVGQFENNIRARYEALRADAEHKDAINVASDLAWNAAQAGSLKTAKSFQALDSEFDKVGLTPEEKTKVLGRTAINAIELGDKNLYTLLRDSGHSVLQDSDFGPAIAKAEQMRIKRAQAEAEQHAQRNQIDILNTKLDVMTKVNDGTLTVDNVRQLVQSGKLTASEGVGYMNAVGNTIEQQQKQAAKEAAATKLRTDALDLLQGGNLSEAKGNEQLYKAAKDAVDGLATDGFMAWTQARQANDPQGMAKGAAAMDTSLALGRKNGILPEPIKARFENTEPSNPQFPIVAERYRDMRAHGDWSFLKANLSAEARARLDGTANLMDTGMDAQQAAAHMASSFVSDDVVNEQMQSNRIKIAHVPLEVARGDAAMVGPVQTFVEEQIRANLKTGMSIGNAIALTKKQAKDNYSWIGGIPVNKGYGLPDDFEKLWDDVQRHVIKPELAKTLGSDATSNTYSVLPVNGEPGKMYIVPSGGNGLFLTKKAFPELAKKLGDTSSGPFIKIDARTAISVGVHARQEFNNRNATIDQIKADHAKKIESQHFVPNTMVSGIGTKQWWDGLTREEQDRLIQERQNKAPTQ